MTKRLVEPEMAHRLLAGGPVVLLASRYRDKVNVMAASWFTPVSMRPPLIAIAIQKDTLTHEFVERSGEFTLNVPSLRLMKEVRAAGIISGKDVDDKLSELGFEPVASEALDTPILIGCLGYVECAVVEVYETGEEHSLFIAEVVAAHADDEVFFETWLLPEEEAKPLHHLGGNTYALLEKSLSVIPRPEEA